MQLPDIDRNKGLRGVLAVQYLYPFSLYNNLRLVLVNHFQRLLVLLFALLLLVRVGLLGYLFALLIVGLFGQQGALLLLDQFVQLAPCAELEYALLDRGDPLVHELLVL